MVEPPISPFNQFQKEDKSHIKKAGLCYSELVTLKKLWESANKIQKKALFPKCYSFTSVNGEVPKEQEVLDCANLNKDSKIKRGNLHINTTFP